MPLDNDPLWYKDAVIYQTHVRAFFDSDADGIGDFKGLTQKLDYVQDLGVTAIWLLPFYPSPLRDDGYDIADYTKVNPAYGTLHDFRTFLREAHRRGIRVITELVLNHTSDQHPWFQRARHAPKGSVYRDFYVWSDTPDRYLETRIIFQDYETSNWSWDPVAQAYYWHRFYAHQPDLNFENPRVKKALFKVVDFWFQMGVDGMRLDAVPYLFEREGTNCENLPETHEVLKELRAHVDAKFSNRMLLAEANQWPEDASAYFGENGDECHMNFHFPLMPRMFMSVRLEDRFPIIDILKQTPPIPEKSQWALFLRNHDELTLEMVTDEERDYMYRSYAADLRARINLGIRRRLGPLLENNRRKIELMSSLLMSLPGTPIVYYGDEIGLGDNIYLGDRDSVRTPMQWSADRNAGFSRANPQKLFLPVIIDPEYHYEAVNVEAQQKNPQSLLWWMKRLIALRKRFKAFGRGSIRFIYPENSKVLAFVRQYENETILVVANLSRFVQHVELDISDYKGVTPVELFGQSELPPIADQPYFLTLGPHNFYWFSLEAGAVDERPGHGEGGFYPSLAVKGSWETILQKTQKSPLERLLPTYLQAQRWFGGKARRIKSAEVREVVPLTVDDRSRMFAMIHVEYRDGEPETYSLPLAWASGEEAERIKEEHARAVVCELAVERQNAASDGILYDAMVDKAFQAELLAVMARRRVQRGRAGELLGATVRTLRLPRDASELEPTLLQGEQSNTSIVYGNRYILKLFRKIDEGVNPDYEIGRFLNEQKRLAHVPAVVGALEYRQPKREAGTVGLLQSYVLNEGNAWNFTLDHLGRFFEHTLSQLRDTTNIPMPRRPLVAGLDDEIPDLVHETFGPFVENIRILGRNTAELHVALAAGGERAAFKPENFTTLYQRSLYQSMRNLTGQTLQLLDKRLRVLPEQVRADAAAIVDKEQDILRTFRDLIERKITGKRIRTHGDYHLGQVLFTGKDFIIIDFEGEPARTITERRLKRSPLRDVAGMLRSFHYAAYTAFYREVSGGIVRPDEMEHEQMWARFWYQWTSNIFLRSYLAAAREGGFLPETPDELQILISSYLLEKAVYELGYELNNRPEWVMIPIHGIRQMLEPSA